MSIFKHKCLHHYTNSKKIEFTIINFSLFTFVKEIKINLETHYTYSKDNRISGRYFSPDKLEELLISYSSLFPINSIGTSENGRVINCIELGSGGFKVLIWSQMHGNESTTTKALLDLLSFLAKETEIQSQFLNFFTFRIIPILNPDGAHLYTRENANKIDLNRDFFIKTQNETKVLLNLYHDFKPDLCLNMHDQRTIFSAGNQGNPATLSFLAPSANEDKTLTKSSVEAMKMIVAMYHQLQPRLDKNIGRFDDTFNKNCAGDTFQSLGTPTILFEAGHFPDDYQREETRKYVFFALIALFEYILKQKPSVNYEDYFSIPENYPIMNDVVVINAKHPDFKDLVSIVIQFEEHLKENTVHFVPKVKKIGHYQEVIPHKTIDAKSHFVKNENQELLKEGMLLKNIYINTEMFEIF